MVKLLMSLWTPPVRFQRRRFLSSPSATIYFVSTILGFVSTRRHFQSPSHYSVGLEIHTHSVGPFEHSNRTLFPNFTPYFSAQKISKLHFQIGLSLPLVTRHCTVTSFFGNPFIQTVYVIISTDAATLDDLPHKRKLLDRPRHAAQLCLLDVEITS